MQREIALIQEFRTRLIADVVTGKFDVRALAAALPETVDAAAAEDADADDEAESDDAALEDAEAAA